MSRRNGTNQQDRREIKRLQRHPQAKENEKFPNLIGRSFRGFKVIFEDGEQIEHEGGLITLDLELIQKHGKIRRAVPI
jgi:hypothetical protein